MSEKREAFCANCGESLGLQPVTKNWEYLCTKKECFMARVGKERKENEDE